MSATPDSKRIGGTTFRQLDGLELLARDLLRLEPIAGLGLEQRQGRAPTAERLIARTGAARRLRRAATSDVTARGRPRRQRAPHDSSRADDALAHTVHLPRLARGGLLRRAAAAPEDFGLDGELVARSLMPSTRSVICCVWPSRARRRAARPRRRRDTTGAAPPGALRSSSSSSSSRGCHWARISVVPGSNTASARSRPTTRWIDAPKLKLERLAARRALDLHLIASTRG